MTAGPKRAQHPTPEEMVARLAPSIERVATERSTAKSGRRAKFPLMAELIDQFRDAGMDPRPVYAKNAAGEEWGKEPDLGFVVDGEKLANLPDYQAALHKMAAKRADTEAAYRARMQRAIRPNRGNE